MWDSEYMDDFDNFFSSTPDSTSANNFDQSFRFDDEEIMKYVEEQLQAPSVTDQSTEGPGMKCGVCGAPAHGYNFDQITCESCKAFFRRNALRPASYFKCRSDNSCVIDVNTRRLCAACRLKKCFDIKMRKDWIRTEEEIEFRQLQKLAREDKKSSSLSPPLATRKKKRLVTKQDIF